MIPHGHHSRRLLWWRVMRMLIRSGRAGSCYASKRWLGIVMLVVAVPFARGDGGAAPVKQPPPTTEAAQFATNMVRQGTRQTLPPRRESAQKLELAKKLMETLATRKIRPRV